MFAGLVAHYVYLAVIFGTFLEGETVLMTAGALCHEGSLSFPIVVACAWLASVTWDQLWFRFGRYFGLPALARRPALQQRVARARQFLSPQAWSFAFGYRFVVGLGTIGPLALGSCGMAPIGFSLASLLGAALWSVCFAALGWGVGRSLDHIFGPTTPWLTSSLMLAVCIAIAWGISFIGRRCSRA